MFANLVFAVVAVAFAHDSGHGPKIEGKGPNGGALAAVVLAKDAELGEKAAVHAVAEYKRVSADEIEVHFFSKDHKKSFDLPETQKWIFLGGKLDKPVVLTRDRKSKTFEKGLLDRAEKVEIIFSAAWPTLGPETAKQVVAFPMPKL